MAKEKMSKGKRTLREKERDINYAERRWMLEKFLKLWECC